MYNAVLLRVLKQSFLALTYTNVFFLSALFIAANNNNNNMPCNVKSIKEKKSHNAIARDLSIWLISAVVQNQKSMAQLFACHKHNFTIRLKF